MLLFADSPYLSASRCDCTSPRTQTILLSNLWRTKVCSVLSASSRWQGDASVSGLSTGYPQRRHESCQLSRIRYQFSVRGRISR